MGDINKQISKSIIWSAIEKFSVQGIQLILTIVIARILIPSDYGLIAMLNVFMAIAQTFVESGFGNALIQKKDRTAIDFSTVFYFNIVVSVLIYISMYICSPYIAQFYEQPQLESITKLFGLTIIINSLGIVQQAKLTINLDFKTQAKASLLAVILSGIIGIWMAYSGWNVWALVWQALANNFFRVIFIWYFSKWVPLIAFSTSSFKILFSFGSKILASSILHTLYVNLYTLIIGKFFTANTCGLYNQAFKLSTFPSTNLTNVIVRAVYPIQCRIQDNDNLLRETYFKYLRAACYIIFPIMVIFCALAKPFVSLCLGNQWAEVVPLLQIMCIAFMWDPIMKINHNILNVKGRSDLFLKAEIIKKIAAFCILVITIPFGIKVMCVGLILYSFIDILIISHYTKKVINITLINQIRTIYPVIIINIIIGIISYINTIIIPHNILQILCGVITGLTAYILISFVFKFQELNFILNRIKGR